MPLGDGFGPAKVGILIASLLAAVGGSLVLALTADRAEPDGAPDATDA